LTGTLIPSSSIYLLETAHLDNSINLKTTACVIAGIESSDSEDFVSSEDSGGNELVVE